MVRAAAIILTAAGLLWYFVLMPYSPFLLFLATTNFENYHNEPINFTAELSEPSADGFFRQFLVWGNKQNSAQLHDERGKLLQSWHTELLPGQWHDTRLHANGSLIVVVKSNAIAALDDDSKIEWILNGRYHHRTGATPSGAILAFRRQMRRVNYNGQDLPVLSDFLDIISPNGKFIRTVDLYKLLQSYFSPSQFDQIARWEGRQKLLDKFEDKSDALGRFKIGSGDTVYDIMHSNSINVYAGAPTSLFEKGDIVLTIRTLNLIVVLDKSAQHIKWDSRTFDLDGPHDGKILPDGSVIVFDNGAHRGWSRLLSIDPVKQQITLALPNKKSNLFWKRGGFVASSLNEEGFLLMSSKLNGYDAILKDGKIINALLLKFHSITKNDQNNPIGLRWID